MTYRRVANQLPKDDPPYPLEALKSLELSVHPVWHRLCNGISQEPEERVRALIKIRIYMRSPNNKRETTRDLQFTARSGPTSSLRAKSILVADDDETILSLITIALSEAGYEVDAVASGVEALEAILRRDYDLVITDNDMPGLTGLELATRIQESSADTPVLLVSAGLFDEPLDNLASSVNAILPKPFCMFQLLEAVCKALEPSRARVPGTSVQLAGSSMSTDDPLARKSD